MSDLRLFRQSTFDGDQYIRYQGYEPLIVDGIEYWRNGGYCEGMMISLKADDDYGGAAHHWPSLPMSEQELDNWVRHGELAVTDEQMERLTPLPVSTPPPVVIDEVHVFDRADMIGQFIQRYGRGGVVPLLTRPNDHVVPWFYIT